MEYVFTFTAMITILLTMFVITCATGNSLDLPKFIWFIPETPGPLHAIFIYPSLGYQIHYWATLYIF